MKLWHNDLGLKFQADLKSNLIGYHINKSTRVSILEGIAIEFMLYAACSRLQNGLALDCGITWPQ